MKKTAHRGRHQRVRFGLVAIAALLGTLVLGPSAMSGPNGKTFTAVFTSTAPGGENGQSMSLTLENLGSPALGSANVTAPAGFAIQSVSGMPAGSSFNSTSIQLRNLNLSSGSPVTFPMSVNIPCPAGPYNWSIVGRQGSLFSGNTFTLDTANSNLATQVSQDCTLSIAVQPNHAEANAPITSTPYNDPVGQSVKVLARNNDNAVPLASDGDTVTLGKTARGFTWGGNGFTGNALPLSGGEVSLPNLKSNRHGFSIQAGTSRHGLHLVPCEQQLRHPGRRHALPWPELPCRDASWAHDQYGGRRGNDHERHARRRPDRLRCTRRLPDSGRRLLDRSLHPLPTPRDSPRACSSA